MISLLPMSLHVYSLLEWPLGQMFSFQILCTEMCPPVCGQEERPPAAARAIPVRASPPLSRPRATLIHSPPLRSVSSAGSFLSHQVDAVPRRRALCPTPHTHVDHHRGPVIVFSLWAHLLFLSLKCQGPFPCPSSPLSLPAPVREGLTACDYLCRFPAEGLFILPYFRSFRVMCRGLLASKDRLTHPCCPFTRSRHVQIICFEMFNGS